MTIYTPFDYLCNEPYSIPNMGTIRSPTLRDIRKLTYKVFNFYINTCSINEQELKEKLNIHKEEKEKITLFNFLLYSNFETLSKLINFFILEDVTYNNTSESFYIFNKFKNKETNEIVKEKIGEIGAENFNIFRNEVLKILGLKEIEVKKAKYKSEKARQLAEKIQKAKSEIKDKSKQEENENLSLDNMIKKYCTYNKVGINILNVWEMTFNQFNTMFAEYSISRQIELNDSMAANTFSFKDSKDYNPELWIETLNKNNS